MSEAIKNILERPDAFQLHAELTEKLNDEKKKREWFYEKVDESVKAEFINGEIVLHSPAKRMHNMVSYNLMAIFSQFNQQRKVGEFAVEKAMVSLTRNDYEPDICFFDKATADKFYGDMTHYPTPDFIVEILSKSTEKIDRGIKFTDYQQHGVSEYWLVDPEKKIVEQFVLENGEYSLKSKASDGTINCHVLEGLSVEVEDIFRG